MGAKINSEESGFSFKGFPPNQAIVLFIVIIVILRLLKI